MITCTESSIHDSPYTKYVQVPWSKNHNHTYWEIIIILSGSITHVINGKSYEQSAGSVVFLRPIKDSHFFIKSPDSKETYRHRDIYINVNNMEKWCGYLSNTMYSNLYTQKEPYMFSIQSTLINHIESVLLSPNFQSTQNPLLYKNVQLSVVIDLLTSWQISKTNTSPPEWLNEFIKKLKNPTNFLLPIETLTNDMHYCHSYICREFKKQTGQTIVNYFINQKISYASYLLVNTNLKIIDILNNVGYDSPKNFINQFTKQFKCSPSEWRKKNQIPNKK